MRGGNPVGRLYHLASHRHEFVKARARNDDRVSTTMRFFGDTHKAPSFIFAEFNIEMLAFDLKFFRDNYVIHDALEGFHLTILHLTSYRRKEGFQLNDTKLLCGKLINHLPQTPQRKRSLFCYQTEVNLLLERIYSRDSNHHPVADHKAHFASAPGDPLTRLIKDKKVVIKRGDMN